MKLVSVHRPRCCHHKNGRMKAHQGSRLQGGFDADHGDIRVDPAKLIDRCAGGSVARNDQRFDAALIETCRVCQGQAENLFSGTGSIGRVGRIAEEQKVFWSKQFHRFPEHTDASYA